MIGRLDQHIDRTSRGVNMHASALTLVAHLLVHVLLGSGEEKMHTTAATSQALQETLQSGGEKVGNSKTYDVRPKRGKIYTVDEVILPDSTIDLLDIFPDTLSGLMIDYDLQKRLYTEAVGASPQDMLIVQSLGEDGFRMHTSGAVVVINPGLLPHVPVCRISPGHKLIKITDTDNIEYHDDAHANVLILETEYEGKNKAESKYTQEIWRPLQGNNTARDMLGVRAPIKYAQFAVEYPNVYDDEPAGSTQPPVKEKYLFVYDEHDVLHICSPDGIRYYTVDVELPAHPISDIEKRGDDFVVVQKVYNPEENDMADIYTLVKVDMHRKHKGDELANRSGCVVVSGSFPIQNKIGTHAQREIRGSMRQHTSNLHPLTFIPQSGNPGKLIQCYANRGHLGAFFGDTFYLIKRERFDTRKIEITKELRIDTARIGPVEKLLNNNLLIGERGAAQYDEEKNERQYLEGAEYEHFNVVSNSWIYTYQGAPVCLLGTQAGSLLTYDKTQKAYRTLCEEPGATRDTHGLNNFTQDKGSQKEESEVQANAPFDLVTSSHGTMRILDTRTMSLGEPLVVPFPDSVHIDPQKLVSGYIADTTTWQLEFTDNNGDKRLWQRDPIGDMLINTDSIASGTRKIRTREGYFIDKKNVLYVTDSTKCIREIGLIKTVYDTRDSKYQTVEINNPAKTLHKFILADGSVVIIDEETGAVRYTTKDIPSLEGESIMPDATKTELMRLGIDKWDRGWGQAFWEEVIATRRLRESGDTTALRSKKMVYVCDPESDRNGAFMLNEYLYREYMTLYFQRSHARDIKKVNQKLASMGIIPEYIIIGGHGLVGSMSPGERLECDDFRNIFDVQPPTLQSTIVPGRPYGTEIFFVSCFSGADNGLVECMTDAAPYARRISGEQIAANVVITEEKTESGTTILHYKQTDGAKTEKPGKKRIEPKKEEGEDGGEQKK